MVVRRVAVTTATADSREVNSGAVAHSSVRQCVVRASDGPAPLTVCLIDGALALRASKKIRMVAK